MSKMDGLFYLSEKLAIVWNRITFSRVTITYFCFTVLHFFVQLALQGQALGAHVQAVDGLTGLMTNPAALRKGLPILQGSTLKVCTWVPVSIQTDDSACSVIWNDTGNHSNSSDSYGAANAADPSDDFQFISSVKSVASTTISTAPSTASVYSSSIARITRTATATKMLPTTSSRLSPTLTRIPSPFNTPKAKKNVTHQKSELSVRNVPDNLCQASLIWPIYELRDAEREDIVFMIFQSWVLGVSIVALLNESIPHIIAALITHLLATAWAGFRIFNTAVFHSEFRRVIVHGTCSGVRLLPHYWDTRCKAELAALILNIAASIISSFLTWKIIKSFGWLTFKRVGASLVISRVYQLVLFLSITIQLSFFFMATTVSLWIDRLINSAVGDLAGFRTLYLVSSGITLTLLIPWLATGWFGVRRELRLPMFFFLFLSLLYLGGWGVMFFSTTFRWTFLTWHLFSAIACASVFFTSAAFVLGVVCRCNFGKGLHRHLNTLFSESRDDAINRSIDIEKLNFPNAKTFIIPALPNDLPSRPAKRDSSFSGIDASLSRSCSPTSVNSSSEGGKRWVIE